MDISIIIVNYNTVDLTLNCLQSIYQHTKGVDFEIILVDNASTDDSVSRIKSDFPAVVLIESPDNLGFGRANNLAIKQAKGEFLFLVNTDITFIQNSVKKLLDFYLENHKKLNIGSLGGLLLNIDRVVEGAGSSFPTAESIITDKLRSMKLSRSPRIRQESKWNFASTFFEVDYVMGADLFIKHSLFNEVGGFDPYFFMYFEETDMSMRLAKQGYKNYIVNDVKIIHSEILKAGDVKVKPFKNNWLRKVVKKSESYYVKKNFRGSYAKYIMVDMLYLVGIFLKSRYTFRENVDFFKESIKNY